MRRPLVSGCLFFCLGILVASFSNIPFFIYYLLALLFFIASLIFISKRILSNAMIYLCVFFIGSIVLKSSQILPINHISRFMGPITRVTSLKGIVNSDPIIYKKGITGRKSFELLVTDIKTKGLWQKSCGLVLVNVFQDKKISYGDELILEGKLYRAPNFNISQRLNYREYLRRKGIYGVLSIGKNAVISATGQRRANLVKELAYKIKAAMKKKIYGYMRGFEADIVKAIILGERQDIPEQLNDIFTQTGTAHILAISGLHIGIITFIFLVLLKIFRVPRKPRYIFAVIILIIYIFITGARASVVRSAVMISIILIGMLLERETDVYNSLACAAIIILAFNPNQLFEIGFQLSFASVISIFYFGYKIQGLFLRIKYLNGGKIRFIISSLSISSGIWIGVLGIIAFYFNIISPITVFANLFIIPLISVIIALSLGVILSGFIAPFLSPLFAIVDKALIDTLISFIGFLSKAPYAYFNIKGFNISHLVSYYIFIILIFNIGNVVRLFRMMPLWQKPQKSH